MNTPFTPPDDELVSAYLDDAVTPDERARVESDPVLLAQVERFRLVADALREPVTPDPVRKEQAIAAALGVLEGSVVPFPSGGRQSLPPPAVRHHGRRPSRWLVVAAAAAVAAVVAVAGVALTGGDDDADVASPSSGPGPVSTGTSGNPDFEPESSIPTSPPAIGQVVELGAFDDLDALVDAVGARPEAGEPAPGRTVSHPCRPIGAQAAYTATLGGDEVVVFLAPDPTSRLLTEGTVYAADDCTELDTFSLA